MLDPLWAAMIKPVMCIKSPELRALLSLGYVRVEFCLFLCFFVFIWVWIIRTQRQQKHTVAQIHKASWIRSDHLGQNF